MDQIAILQGPVPFSLAPALVDQEILDLCLPSAQKLFNKGCEALEDKFDLSPGDLKSFLANMDDRAARFGWTAILNVPTDLNFSQALDRVATGPRQRRVSVENEMVA